MKRTALKPSRTRIRNRRLKSSGDFWKLQGDKLHSKHGGVCAKCSKKVERLDAAHIVGIGNRVPYGRHNQGHPLNSLENLVGLCRSCHEWFDSLPKLTRIAIGAELQVTG